MSYKFDYISRLLQKASSKRMELYTISRIWHLLDNYDVKIVPQQYVSRESTQYALTDVYFPQFGLHIEVYEPAHYDNDEKVRRDYERYQEIESKTGHHVIVIDCRQDILGIHSQIDNVVSRINLELKDQISNKIFRPWKPENEHNPRYWKEQGYISVSDDVSFYKIEDICLLFDADYQKTKRGFLRRGAIENPKHTSQIIWWPSERPRSGWINRYDPIKETITESHLDQEKNLKYFSCHAQGMHIRICFFHQTDILGLTNYKFLGIFTNNNEKSNPQIGTVWQRIGNRIDLGTCEVSYSEAYQ